ncbi:MAG: hypothetical protein ACJAVV_001162 [Alphaproteobacteria bacterium]|jgi:uncharacterized protein YbbC (DUF1343 family)
MNIRNLFFLSKYFWYLIASLLIVSCQTTTALGTRPAQINKPASINSSDLVLGAQNIHEYLASLQGKRVGLVVNQTSMLYKYTNNTTPQKAQHLVDFLRSHNVNVVVMFAPEHGVRGNKGAGEHIENGKDANTLIPIQSIYGKNKTPPSSIMQNLDLIIFDIQDVGTRFYTYISSMHYMMEAAAAHDVEFIVLDRPNPNGEFTDGPVLDMSFQSFVGMHPIPILHGLTVGELALMIKGEKWIENAENLRLKVVNMLRYKKSLVYDLPVAPSPNLPNYQAIRLYPSLCFFEPTAVSIGRGTEFPFQVTGHDRVRLGDFAFTPVSKPFAAPSPKLINTPLLGLDLQQSNKQGLDLRLFIEYYQAFKAQNITFYTTPSFMDKLAGTDKLRKAIEDGVSIEDIRESWQADLTQYKEMRKPYLLYAQ